MSRIHYNFDITLKNLVNFSNLIVVATKKAPFIKVKKMNIGLDKPYDLVQNNYLINEVIYGDIAFLNQTILVLNAEWENKLKIYKRYVKDGMSISPNYQCYTTSCEIGKEEKIILFLQQSNKNEIRYTNIYSYESYCKLEEIKSLLTEQMKSS